MKLKHPKFTILFSITAVFFSAIFCCCLTDVAKAEEQPVPSCHQTTQGNELPQSAEECDCDQELAVLEQDIIKINPIEVVVLLYADTRVDYEFYLTALTFGDHAPPIIYDTSPLYIKHSTFRI